MGDLSKGADGSAVRSARGASIGTPRGTRSVIGATQRYELMSSSLCPPTRRYWVERAELLARPESGSSCPDISSRATTVAQVKVDERMRLDA